VCAELSGLEAHVTLGGAGTITREVLQGARGFTDEEWERAEASLLDRGLLGEDRALTEAGMALRRQIESTTDRAAAAPWAALGAEGCEALLSTLSPLTAAIAAGGVVPQLNPIGLPGA
jgi:hypothetical protein